VKRLGYGGRVLPSVLFILMLPVAFAAITQDRDRADNAYEFTWDANQRDITSASSSLRFTRDDLVQFTVVVDDTTTAPLVGRVTMELATERTVKYDGALRFTVFDGDGADLYAADRHVTFTLKPNGRRSRTVLFPFDLEGTGNYSVTASFRAGAS
jgi:hypothetical protein